MFLWDWFSNVLSYLGKYSTYIYLYVCLSPLTIDHIIIIIYIDSVAIRLLNETNQKFMMMFELYLEQNNKRKTAENVL